MLPFTRASHFAVTLFLIHSPMGLSFVPPLFGGFQVQGNQQENPADPTRVWSIDREGVSLL